MPDPPPDTPQLRCPTCGYDLRGTHVQGRVFRCPECGAITDTLAIVEHHRERRRSTRHLLAGLGFAAALFVGLILARPFFRGRGDLSAVLTIFAVATLLFWAQTVTWIDAPQRLRLAAAGASALLLSIALMLFTGPAAFVGVIASMILFGSFYAWAFHRGYY
jgi:hypothetical protein